MHATSATILGAALALAATAPRAAGAQQPVKLDTTSKVVIEGTSNLHKWTCASAQFEMAVDAPQSAPADVGKTLTALVVTIPVSSIDCGEGGMTKNLRKALHADRYPTIRFRMTSYASVPRAGSYTVHARGILTVNGTDKPVELHSTVTPNGAGGASAVGSTPLDTREFGVPPVRALLGALRTSPQVTITFRLTASR